MRSSVVCTWPAQKNDVLSGLVNDCRFGGFGGSIQMKKQTGIRKGLLRSPVGLPPSFWKGTRLGYDEAGNNRDLFRHLVARCLARSLLSRSGKGSSGCDSDGKAILTELASRWPAPRTTSQPSRQRGPYVESTKPKSHTPLSEPGTRLPEAPSSVPRMQREYSRARAPALTPFRSLP